MNPVRKRYKVQAAFAMIRLGGKCDHCGSDQHVEWEIKAGEPRKRTKSGNPISIAVSEHSEIMNIIETQHSDRLGLRCANCRIEGKSHREDWSYLWIMRPVFLEDFGWDDWVAFVLRLGVPEDHGVLRAP